MFFALGIGIGIELLKREASDKLTTVVVVVIVVVVVRASLV